MEQNPPWKAPHHSTIKEFPFFYGTHKLITCLQKPDIGPYPKPDKPSPHPHILFFFKICKYILIIMV
jgi:hypothetical protein